MANVMMNLFKGQRMDITAQMKDADAILESFRNHNVRFDKKYTSINKQGPSTITFKGIRAENHHCDITDVIADLQAQAKEDHIGNVYVKFTTFQKPIKKEEEKPASSEPEKMPEWITKIVEDDLTL